MERLPLFELMDELTSIVNTTPVENAPEQLLRRANLAGNVLGMEALCHMLVIENARRRHAEAKCNAVNRELEEMRNK